MKRYNLLFFILLFFVISSLQGCAILKPAETAERSKANTGTLVKAQPETSKSINRHVTHLDHNIFNKTIKDLGSRNGKNILVITNAGYGDLNGKSSEKMIDMISDGTGCTPGRDSLITVHTPYYEPFWAAVIETESLKCTFIKNQSGNFKYTNLDLSPRNILTPEGWNRAMKTNVGTRLFSIVSIAYAADAGADWNMLRAAELHDHFCPGLNAGFIVQAYMEKNFPLAAGDKYIFVGAPPMCAMDALQSLNGATPGKKGVFSMRIADMVNGAIAKDGIKPVIIAMRVNKNKTDGAILGFDFDRISKTTGVTSAALSPEGGHSNPLFYISRIKTSWKMAGMPMKEKMTCIEEVKKFSGPAALAYKIENAKANPYAPIILSDF
jgi:formylmethanofuran dehydrogenase subunit E-like metal-binding protein